VAHYHLPTLILPANVWRFGNATTNPPDVQCLVNLIPGRRHVVETSPGAGPSSDWLPASFALLSVDADVRDEAGTGGSPDTIEIPSGSSRYYFVQYIEFVGLGFANQHQQAVLVKIAPFPFPAFGVVHLPLLVVSVDALLPFWDSGEGYAAPLLDVPISVFNFSIATTPNVTKLAPLLSIPVYILAPVTTPPDANPQTPLLDGAVTTLTPTVTTGTPPTVGQFAIGHNPTGVSPLVNLSWPSPTTAGSTLIAVLGGDSSDDTTITYASPWVLVAQVNGTDKSLFVFLIQNAASQSTTGNFGSNGDACDLAVYEVAGLGAAPTFDVGSGNVASSGTSLSTGTSGATSAPTEFVLASWFIVASGVTLSSPTNGFALDGQTISGHPSTLGSASKSVTSTGTQECTVTASGTSDFVAGIFTFKP